MEGDIIAGPGKLGPKDPHAGDKRKLAKSHRPKELPVDNPAAHEGKTITHDTLEQMGAERRRKEAEGKSKAGKQKPTQEAGDSPPVVKNETEVTQETSGEKVKKDKEEKDEISSEETEVTKKLEPINKEAAIAQGWPPSSDWDFLTKDWTGEEQAFLLQFVGWAKSKYTLAGPYKDGKYVVLNGANHVKDTRDKKVVGVAEKVWKELGGERKLPEVKSGDGEKGLTANDLMTKQEIQEVPFVKQFQYDFALDAAIMKELGNITYEALLRTGLIRSEQWQVVLVDREDPRSPRVLAETLNKFDAATREALTKLEAASGNAKEIEDRENKMIYKIKEGDASNIILRQRIREIDWNVSYWKMYGRLAASMLPSDLAGEFWKRMEVLTQLEFAGKAMEQKNAEVARALPPPAEALEHE